MNGAPDWQDGECCFRCRTQFTLVARKHHCRNCGNIFCAKCSSQQTIVPKVNIERPVRVCDGCYEKLSKNDETLVLASVKKGPEAGESTQPKQRSNSKTSVSSKSSASGGSKPPTDASAPSEQELKEEEELQLALALSLSEAPTKVVSYPDCSQLEAASTNVASSSITNSSARSKQTDVSNSTINSSNAINSVQTSSINQMQSSVNEQLQQYITNNTTSSIATPVNNVNNTPEQMVPNTLQTPYPQDYQTIAGDMELFRFVAEVQSTAEVFTNRINSNKLRNRPIADDSAIQSLFLKLTNQHTKLLEYIKKHEEERAGFESIQDKLSQISDARAALDALREEHQEKIRQEAAEAERQRQSQLSLKLEMMRQKKSEMMQYQREMALQRIQAQDMILRQGSISTSAPTSIPSSIPSSVATATSMPKTSIPSQSFLDQSQMPIQSQAPMHVPPVTSTEQQQQQHYSPPTTTVLPSTMINQSQIPTSLPQIPQLPAHMATNLYMPPQSQLQQPAHQLQQPTHQQNQQMPQSPAPEPSKLEDEAPLICFDD